MTVHIINPDDPKVNPETDIKTICQEVDNVLHFLISRYDIDDRSIAEVVLARLRLMFGKENEENFNQILKDVSEWKS
jgi:hypothetical protein